MELQFQGRTGLVEPQELYQLCLLAGLVEPVSAASSAASASDQAQLQLLTADQQRSAVLTAALENHLVSMVTGCIMHWKDGETYNNLLTCLLINLSMKIDSRKVQSRGLQSQVYPGLGLAEGCADQADHRQVS